MKVICNTIDCDNGVKDEGDDCPECLQEKRDRIREESRW